MNESFVNIQVTIPAYCDAAEVFEPGIGSLNVPSAFVPSELSEVFPWTVHAIVAVRNNEVHSPLSKTLSPFVIVVALVRNDPLRNQACCLFFSSAMLFHFHPIDRLFSKMTFLGRSTVDHRIQRYPVGIGDDHDHGTFAGLGFTDTFAPF
jgi:hypothetical protein